MENSRDSFADLFEQESQKKLRHFNPGEKVTATVIDISGETVFLDVGGKSEGILEAAELKNEEGEISIQPGDKLDVYFLSTSGAELKFASRLGSGSGAAHLEDAWRSGIPVEGFVKAEIKGGFEVTLGGNIRGFCPYSQMSLRRVEDPAATFLETHMTFKITRFENNGRNIVLSARAILEEEREIQREKLKETLNEGDTIEGEISSIRDFGAFVDLGGVDGLIPISEMGWSRVEKVDEVFTLGQKVETVVKSIDWDKNRISLSYKETLEDPWDKAAESFPAGAVCTGTVSRLADFGAFVTLTPGVDGLIHISKLGGGRKINHPAEVLEAGQQVEVTVETVDSLERRIGLAPSDYVSPEKDVDKEKAEYKQYVSTKKESKSSNMGTFGDLLKAKMAEKKK